LIVEVATLGCLLLILDIEGARLNVQKRLSVLQPT
jgi:hypothetical protein